MAATELLLIRHGESVGNVAREEAESGGAEVISMSVRDPDVPLSPLGVEQATAVGLWLREMDDPPQQAWSSPYVRAHDTARTALTASDLNLGEIHRDERLRDRELGVLDLLTSHGVRARYPSEAERRAWLGKFYYRPPGGESWADVALRVRSFLTDLDRPETPDRILIVAHDAVILLFRYVIENLDEHALMAAARAGSIRNCSATRLLRADSTWRAGLVNDDSHLDRYGARSSAHPGDVDAAHT